MRIFEIGTDRVEDLEGLWKALQKHHSNEMPSPAGLAPRELEVSWRMRREKYRLLLAGPGAFALVAEEDEHFLGYAMVRVASGSIGYATANKVGEVETLSVAASARGRGIGNALMDAVEQRLRAAGVKEIRLSVVAGNEEAVRFYQRRGMAPFAITLIGKLAGA